MNSFVAGFVTGAAAAVATLATTAELNHRAEKRKARRFAEQTEKMQARADRANGVGSQAFYEADLRNATP